MSSTRGTPSLVCCLIAAVSLFSSYGTTTFCVGFLLIPTIPAGGLYRDRGGVFKNCGLLSKQGVAARPASAGAKAEGKGTEEEVMVFDAEGAVSWDEYKSKQPDEYKVRNTVRCCVGESSFNMFNLVHVGPASVV